MKHLTAFALACAASAASGSAQAATIAALQDSTSIVWIDTDKKAVVGSVALDGGAQLVGIDIRPANGKLYGVARDGAIVIVDAKTGKWEKKSQLSEKLPADAMITVDFNPVADRLRVMTSTGVNLRVNVDDGKATIDGALKYAESDAAKGKAAMITAGGYTNSCAGTKETALYDIDSAAGTLVRQAPPNDGILNTVGKLDIKSDGPLAFDVWSDCKGVSTGWAVSAGSLYTVDLKSAVVTRIGEIAGLKGKISDIAILPAE